MKLDLTRVADVEVEGIDHKDAPDYCDAFISYASYNGIPMTEKELDALNDESSFVYEAVQKVIY